MVPSAQDVHTRCRQIHPGAEVGEARPVAVAISGGDVHDAELVAQIPGGVSGGVSGSMYDHHVVG